MNDKSISESAIEKSARELTPLAGAVWGFAEATFFFMIPDILITWVALFSWRRGFHQVWATGLGAVCGGILMFYAAHREPAMLRDMVERVPFVTAPMFDTTAAAYREHGVWALCRGPMAGIPYKIYAVIGPDYVSSAGFARVSILARVERFILSWLLFSLIGVAMRRYIIPSSFPHWTFALHLVFWLMVYTTYWFRIWRE